MEKGNIKIWIIGLIVVIVLGIGGYIIYDKVFKEEQPTEKETNKGTEVATKTSMQVIKGVAEITIGQDDYQANKTIGEIIEDVSGGNPLDNILLDYSQVIPDLKVKITAKISCDGDMPILDATAIYLKDEEYVLQLADYRTFDALKVLGFNNQVALVTDSEYFSSLDGYNLIFKVYGEKGLLYEDSNVINSWYQNNERVNSKVELGEDYIIYYRFEGTKDRHEGEKFKFYSKDKLEIVETFEGVFEQ